MPDHRLAGELENFWIPDPMFFIKYVFIILMSYAYSEIKILVQGMAGNLRELETQITIGAEKIHFFFISLIS